MIVQISDCHLFAEARAELRGVRTRERLGNVLAQLPAIEAVEWLILTGDLAHDHLADTYRQLRDLLAPWLPRVRLIPGNHDDRDAMREVFADCIRVCGERNVFCERLGTWRLIGLDTQVPGELYGRVGRPQLDWFDEQLCAAAAQPVVVFMHHPPVLMDSPWLDRIALEDAAAVREVLSAHPHVRLVCTGHVHQESTHTGPPVVVTTPATGLQFRPRTSSLEIDDAPPGFRLLDLMDDGSVRTRVMRVTCPA